MSKVYQKIEMTANILIIVVALLVGGMLVQRYFFKSAPLAQERKTPTVGAKISDAKFDWSKSNKNVLLVLQKGCKYCTESAEFYKKLIQNAQDKNVKITAVLPQSKEDAEKYLSDLGVTGIEVKQSALDALDVSGTPTIIIVNNNGEISNFWIGKLPAEKEEEVLNNLRS
jgi:thioredoxin-related protein